MKKIFLYILLFFIGMYFASPQLKTRLMESPVTIAGKNEGENRYEEEGKTDHPDKFLEYQRAIRTRSDEKTPGYPSNYKWKELKKARINQFARMRNARTKSNGVTEWKERGPGNVPGRIRALYAVPSDALSNTWLAGAATGGIWRTTDGGATWSEKSADFPALPISSFASDNAGSVIYAATGEFVSSIYSAIGNGIYRSTDNGVSWAQLANTSNFGIVTRVITHPTNANLILATTVPSNTQGTSAIMRSTDGGLSWTKVKEVNGPLEQIVATPGNFATLFASENSVGIWKSTDAGLTWTLSNSGMKPTGRLEISVSQVNPSKIFVSSQGTLSGTESDLYISSNAGASWSLVDVTFAGAPLDFFEGQGFYDNTILAHPFVENEVYFGGVSLFKASVASTSTSVSFFEIEEEDTDFIFLQTFSNVTEDGGRLQLGPSNNSATVEIRFGPGEKQKAHRFEVPAGATSGVAVTSYEFKNYVDVPFEVWDVTTNRQLMISFRDQGANGKFDLVEPDLTSAASLQSREYLYIHNIAYSETQSSAVTINGGHETNLMYNLYPALATGAIWNDNVLPLSKLTIEKKTVQKFTSTTVTVADGRGDFDDKNGVNQVNLELGVHPDHHCIVPLITNQTAKTFRLIIGNDGGVFVSKSSTTPGTTEGDWTFRGLGLNTSQFYGVDKKPGEQVYFGGMQDNGTRISKNKTNASKSTPYTFAIGGDGFEVLWNSKNPNLMLGSIYYGQIWRSINGGTTWQQSTNGFTSGQGEFPFVTSLANSKDLPDRVFTVGVQGVYRSENFGQVWALTPISSNFISGGANLFDVEVSRANANIIWAGSGMDNVPPLASLHVSGDGGKTFTATNNYTQTALGPITKLASHPTQPNTAYALFSFSDSPKILRTTNLGQSWEDITGFGTNNESSNGFPDVAVYCLYVRPDNPDILWAGTEIGIVESLDNGATWALLNDFINVSVFEMKGQDNEVVIATHGRGIWTATLEHKQESLASPEISAAGTAPDKKFAVRIKTEEFFDSVVLYSNASRVLAIKNAASGTREITIPNFAAGAKELRAFGYVGDAPHQSMVVNATHYDLMASKNSYSTYFTSTSDLALKGLELQNFSSAPAGQRKTLHTNHSYSPDTQYEVFVKTPVTVSPGVPTLYYSDIAVIEPDNDFIFVEATKNGLDWLPLTSKYDASFAGDLEGKWLTAYLSKTMGTVPMFVHHQIDISKTFSAGDLLLFRFRMTSGMETTAWGWALNYISIQEPPVATELSYNENFVSVYPNPSKGNLRVTFELKESSDVGLKVVDLFGKTVYHNQLKNLKPGVHSQELDIASASSGHYLLIFNSAEGRRTQKLVVVR